jgi:hypothetical protein
MFENNNYGRTIPAFVGGNKTKVFPLGFRALADASRDSALELVRTSNTAVSILKLDSQANGIADSVTTP